MIVRIGERPSGPAPGYRVQWPFAAACALACGCYSGLGDNPAASGGGDGAEDAAGSEDGGSEGGDSGEPSGECAAQIASRPLQRLTPLQYRNTIRDLFGDAEFEASYADEETLTTQLGVRQLRTDAEQVLARRSAWTRPVFPCATAGQADDACVDGFITEFGRRALRRPVDDETRAWLRASYDAAIAEGLSFSDAMDVLLATLLQSPALVYRIETGVPVEGQAATIRKLDDHEIASRLSYFLWDTMPDDALLDAADAGELADNGGLRTQIERLLADPRSEGKLQHFVSGWLQLDGGQLHLPLEESMKDAELFPEYDAGLQTAMRDELEAFVHKVFYEQDAAFEQLFVSRDAYVNASLAALYGVTDGPADDDTWKWVQLPEAQRAGLLTRAGFLTVFAAARPQSPIRRGVVVIEEVMCQALGDPPPNASDTPVEGGEDVDEDGNPIVRSVREDVSFRTEQGSCIGCHGAINPVGFTLEHYDAIGRWQDIEVVTGQPIDSSGALIGDVEGPVKDGIELSSKLASSEMVRACFADRWLGQALGVQGAELDPCTQAAVRESFVASGDMRELLVSIVLSDAFRYLNTAEGA
ncbi:MAG: DUF1592 domain-containing protein [Deltaproteobacteria bacterium]|nr:DUF1592 domain-containing protein [Nannocystaceae bacterium]